MRLREGREVLNAFPRQALEEFLGDLAAIGYAVAKAPDLWGNLARGGDWDLVVLDVEASVRLLVERVGPPEAVTRRSYVVGVHYAWGHVDLLPGLAWRGVELASARDVVLEAVAPEVGPRVAALSHQVLAACVYPMLAHSSYNARYTGLLAMSPAERDSIEAAVAAIFGPGWGLSAVLDPTRIRSSRRRAALRSLRTPDGLRRWWAFVATELRVRAAGGRASRRPPNPRIRP